MQFPRDTGLRCMRYICSSKKKKKKKKNFITLGNTWERVLAKRCNQLRVSSQAYRTGIERELKTVIRLALNWSFWGDISSSDALVVELHLIPTHRETRAWPKTTFGKSTLFDLEALSGGGNTAHCRNHPNHPTRIGTICTAIASIYCDKTNKLLWVSTRQEM